MTAEIEVTRHDLQLLFTLTKAERKELARWARATRPNFDGWLLAVRRLEQLRQRPVNPMTERQP